MHKQLSEVEVMHRLSETVARESQSCERGVIAVGVDYTTDEPVAAIAVVGPDSLAFVTVMPIGIYDANLN